MVLLFGWGVKDLFDILLDPSQVLLFTEDLTYQCSILYSTLLQPLSHTYIFHDIAPQNKRALLPITFAVDSLYEVDPWEMCK